MGALSRNRRVELLSLMPRRSNLRSRIHYTRKRNQLYRFLLIVCVGSLHDKLRHAEEEQRETTQRPIHTIHKSQHGHGANWFFFRARTAVLASESGTLFYASRKNTAEVCFMFLKSCVYVSHARLHARCICIRDV